MTYQYITEDHRSDDQGRPAGGETHGLGIDIRWQDGPLRLPVDDYGHYQQSEFRCRENARAITKIEEALHWCRYRTADRERRGVEGTHQL